MIEEKKKSKPFDDSRLRYQIESQNLNDNGLNDSSASNNRAFESVFDTLRYVQNQGRHQSITFKWTAV